MPKQLSVDDILPRRMSFADKLLIAVASIAATFAFIGAVWAVHLLSLFWIHGSEGTQEYLIGSLGVLIYTTPVAALAAIAPGFVVHGISRRAWAWLCSPAILVALSFAALWLTNKIAYP